MSPHLFFDYTKQVGWALPTIAIMVGNAYPTLSHLETFCGSKSLRDHLTPGEKCGLEHTPFAAKAAPTTKNNPLCLSEKIM
jgi:hypothetical protein